MPASFALLAVSSLAAATPIVAVPQMFARLRAQVLAEAVTGVAVFDGAGFCVYLEGERAAVLRCHAQAGKESRHTEIEALWHGTCASRRYAGFFSGYALAEGLPASEQLRPLEGTAALACFLSLAPDFDLNF